MDTGLERVKLMKLLWDCLGTEFGGRHELYEINYGGSTEEIRRYCLFGAQANGNADRFRGFPAREHTSRRRVGTERARGPAAQSGWCSAIRSCPGPISASWSGAIRRWSIG
jgi:hypothetical protein